MCSRLIPRRRGTAALAVALILAAFAGCGDSAPVAADPARTREILESTLSSWKNGEKAEALKSASPAVLVEDPKWKRGEKLVKYEVEGDGKPSGSEQAFTVTLWFTDSKGKEVREQAVYKVGTDPIVTVFRSLF
ncbi:MAG: hypothetical protein U0835_03030 [Isosphaeraceae bacterium]